MFGNVRRGSLLALATGAAVAGCVIAPTFLLPIGAPSAAAADYPSWSDIEKAKGDASATAAQVAQIDSLLDSLNADAAALGDRAVAAQGTAQAARAESDTAALRVDDLTVRAEGATRAAQAAARQAGAITARLARGGDPSLDLWLAADQAESTLDRLSSLQRVTGTLADLRETAARQLADAEALTGQASAAAALRDRSARAAEAAASDAEAARAAADARVVEARTRSATLYAQLASLNDTTAALEQQYRDGKALEESYARQAASSPTPSGDSGAPSAPGGSSDGGTAGSPTTGEGSLSPADARSYAAGQVAARGWGSGENQCLVSLWNRESSWRWNALNSSSGAYGIPQAYPGSKMAAAGDDWRTNARTQIDWGLGYITRAYGTPCGAWAHSERVGWY